MIDFHAHLYHPDWYPKKFREATAIDYLKRTKQPITAELVEKTLVKLERMISDRDGSRSIKLMNTAGITKKVILVLDFGYELGEADKTIETINQEILVVCNHYSDRLIGFAGVDPRRKNAKLLFEKAIKLWGAKGLKLHPTGSWGLLDNDTVELVAIAAEYKLPVLSHIGKTVDYLKDDNAKPEKLINLALLFPETTFIAGHSGFSQWRDFAVNKKNVPDNLFFDISGWQDMAYFSKNDTLIEMKELMSVFPNRVLFGTDGPFFGFNMAFAEKNWLDFYLSASENIVASIY